MHDLSAIVAALHDSIGLNYVDRCSSTVLKNAINEGKER
jgi:hypothetical protein